MNYEDALVEDNCAQASLESISKDALAHYEGISKAVSHWNSFIARAIKEYPDLKHVEEAFLSLVEKHEPIVEYCVKNNIGNIGDDPCVALFEEYKKLKNKYGPDG